MSESDEGVDNLNDRAGEYACTRYIRERDERSSTPVWLFVSQPKLHFSNLVIAFELAHVPFVCWMFKRSADSPSTFASHLFTAF